MYDNIAVWCGGFISENVTLPRAVSRLAQERMGNGHLRGRREINREVTIQ